MLKKQNILFNISYITNFKPALTRTTIYSKLYIYKSMRENNHILCRNFFLFLLYMRYCYSKKYLKTVSIFIKPFYSNVQTILRAPYRYKLGRYQIGLSRYNILCSFVINKTNNLTVTNLNHIVQFVLLCKKFYPWFESNICYQHRVLFAFHINFNQNFLIKNYKKDI